MKHSKYWATIVSFIFVFLMIYPLKNNWDDKPKDDFPFSHYPMFSKKRNNPYSLNYMIGYDKSGSRHIIPYKYMGSGGLNQVRHQINQYRRTGRGQLLVNKVARRITRIETFPYNQIDRIEFVRGAFKFNDYFIDNKTTPINEQVIASKQIKRKSR